AAVMITDDEDGLRAEGVLGDTLRIRPSSVSERNADGHIAHEIFHVSLRHPGGNFRSANNEVHSIDNSHPVSIFLLLELDIYATVSPEVHVIIDSAHTKNFKVKTKIMEYMAIFIACVNLKFRTLLYVDVQLVVTKITTFHVSATASSFVSVDAKLGSFRRSFPSTLQSTVNFKVVKTFWTALLLSQEVTLLDKKTMIFNRDVQTKLQGLANPGGACGLWTRGALVEDVAKTFDGVTTFAHECGH
uniref:Uncharacterized protein n=2 Tax=Ixodes scapularis TaxID=6945 RepID=A0A1S4M414_IXOSC